MSSDRNGGPGPECRRSRSTAQDLSGRCRSRRRDRLRGRPRRGVRPARPERRGKSTTIGMLTTTVAPTSDRPRRGLRRGRRSDRRSPCERRRVPGSGRRRSLTGQRNLDIHARLWGVPKHRPRRRSPTSPSDSVWASSSTVRSPPTAAGSAAASRSPVRLSPAAGPVPRRTHRRLDPRIRYELLDLIGGLRTDTRGRSC